MHEKTFPCYFPVKLDLVSIFPRVDTLLSNGVHALLPLEKERLANVNGVRRKHKLP